MARPKQARPPLWVWFIAVQWMDVVWSVLVLLGIEKLRIVPGFTQANSLDFYYMPYTHSLPGSVLLSLVFGVIVALFTSGNRVTTILLVAAASFSHWVLDLVVHVHDLPLYDNAAKIGFGLWRHVVLSFYANFGPPPSSPEAMAATALAFYLVLALLAAWVEPIATSRPI